MAAMSVIGIDFGNESCYIAVARAGGIETIANDYSLRNTPSCVAFTQKNRVLGVAAKNQMVTNMKNTIHGFKRLLGRKYFDPQVQTELRSLTYKTSKQPDGSIGIHVQYLGEEHVFTPEQITAMLFTKLKEVSEHALQTAVNDCVISVPSYFTQAERHALLDAARIAGLNVLRLFNETTATALCYGIYKQDLPPPESPPRNVVFVDCGYASLQVCICAFHKGKLKMLACASDSNLGGRDIDTILAHHFAKDFQARYKIDAFSNPRAYLRLLAEVEKLKKQMSANSTKLPLNIECFIDEKDVHGDMKREDMEAMCAHLFDRVEAVLKKCLHDSELKLDDIHSVEIAGGSSRIPAIKRLIESVFKKPASTTLNQDESVARGCALQCAMLSPAVRVREFSITDIQPYPIKLTWDPVEGEQGEIEIFSYNHQFPFSKYLTLKRSNPFTLNASYMIQPPNYPQAHIGSFAIKNVKPTPEGDPSKVKIKVRLNLNGILTVASASLIEKRELTQEEKEEEEKQSQQQQANNMDVDQQQQSQQNQDKTDQDAQANEPPAQEGEDKAEDKNKKKVPVRHIELPVEIQAGGLPQEQLHLAIEKEAKMVAEDKHEKERVDARNALEEYVYDLRSKIFDDTQLAKFVTDEEREKLSRVLEETENWLYDQGEDCSRQIYSDRLTELKSQGEPIKERQSEFEGRQYALNDLASALQLAKKNYEQIKASYGKDDKYSHLTEEDIEKLNKAIQEKWSWLEEAYSVFASTPRTQLASITVVQIRSMKQALDSTVSPIINKPKPKAEPPKNEKTKEKSAEEQKNHQNSQKNSENDVNQQSPKDDKMDVE
ncbi:heat shock 70 kDa protein 4L isoform X2 [Chelonus insularis]|uniref:heat shock 70 kDa protein 4L isoform X2 n=1 Tax=Chelonus insularis TaxID=460826 RepID=UPI00158C1C98|nr:heat shock 70 kDa protein 4L isoform X2 [Chelonus insularis]